MFGDKEIVVKVHGNSHYRNLKARAFIKSECLSDHAEQNMLMSNIARKHIALIEVSWANGEAESVIRQGIAFFGAPKRALLFYFFYIKHIKGDLLKMKQTMKITTSLLLIVILLFCAVSCAEKIDAVGLWDNATYRSDKTFGTGEITVQLEVKVEDQSVTFTIKTDEETLGAALLEHKLIEGEEGQYGLYVKKVNGITADYDIDQSYWVLYKNGEYCMTGVDTTSIADGEHYEFVYSK